MRVQSGRFVALLTWLVLQLTSGSAIAWGPHGHEAVGAIADQLIAGTPTAEHVRQILGSNLQTASGWADCARSVESSQGVWTYTNRGKYPSCKVYENPASEKALIDFVKRNASRCGGFASSAQCRHKAYHFVDLSAQHAHYDPASPGAGPTDLVQAINATLLVLQGHTSPPPFDIRGQKEALRLLAHYIGDLHQPLHVGSLYLDDAGHPLEPATAQQADAYSNAGGNQILIEGSNLHALWDDVPDRLFKQLLSGSGASAARASGLAQGELSKWPADWAGESIGQAGKAFAGVKIAAKHASTNGATWPATASEPDYRVAREKLQDDQLTKAGARLAQILRSLFP